MEKVIAVYILDESYNTLWLPVDATVLTAQQQGEQLVLWVALDLHAKKVERYFVTYITGEPLRIDGALSYIATVQFTDAYDVITSIHVFEHSM